MGGLGKIVCPHLSYSTRLPMNRDPAPMGGAMAAALAKLEG
jgi:hypothetical protein